MADKEDSRPDEVVHLVETAGAEGQFGHQLQPHMPSISDANGDGYLHELQQAIEQDATQEMVHDPIDKNVTMQEHLQTPQLSPGQDLIDGQSVIPAFPKTSGKKESKSRPSLLDMSESERVQRRRAINRNSQRRIRERRMKELEELRTETGRLQEENERLVRQVECITAEKAELLRQTQDITEKWQQSIAENAALNRENLQLRTTHQQLAGLPTVVAGSIASGVPVNQQQQNKVGNLER